jgi:hypothetical protein
MKNRIKKFTEAIEITKFKEVSDSILKFIEGTVNLQKDENAVKKFLELYIKNPQETKIEGLTEPDQIFDFYQQYRNQIDECLNEVKFFNDPAGVNRLYDYIIKGTQFAILEFVKSMNESY